MRGDCATIANSGTTCCRGSRRPPVPCPRWSNCEQAHESLGARPGIIRPMRLFPTRVSILQMRLFLLLALIGCRATPPDGVPTIEMPDNDPGIGFDDMRYSRARGVILVPGGRSGYLDLVDPVTRRVD